MAPTYRLEQERTDEMRDRFAPNTTMRWHAGETGCAQLIVGLKQRVTQLSSGEMLEVISLNAGASIDIFVWCRMTGNRLLSDAHPVYVIQRAND